VVRAHLQDHADEREAGADEDGVAAAERAAQVGGANDADEAARPRDAVELPAVDLLLVVLCCVFLCFFVLCFVLCFLFFVFCFVRYVLVRCLFVFASLSPPPPQRHLPELCPEAAVGERPLKRDVVPAEHGLREERHVQRRPFFGRRFVVASFVGCS
jgi:hypothetical protein